MSTTLIIPAAGRGLRFGGEIPKQLLPLSGRTVLAWSLSAFTGLITDAIIAISEDQRTATTQAVEKAGVPFPVRLITGGATRQESVERALIAANGSTILIHDAVRPLIPRSCIEACLRTLEKDHAVVLAVPCTATVKRAQEQQVRETVARDDLWLAQTPQGFHREDGLAAFSRARAEGWVCSDDAQVLERAGYAVTIVPGDARNLKITTRDDLILAEALMRVPHA